MLKLNCVNFKEFKQRQKYVCKSLICTYLAYTNKKKILDSNKYLANKNQYWIKVFHHAAFEALKLHLSVLFQWNSVFLLQFNLSDTCKLKDHTNDVHSGERILKMVAQVTSSEVPYFHIKLLGRTATSRIEEMTNSAWGVKIFKAVKQHHSHKLYRNAITYGAWKLSIDVPHCPVRFPPIFTLDHLGCQFIPLVLSSSTLTLSMLFRFTTRH